MKDFRSSCSGASWQALLIDNEFIFLPEHLRTARLAKFFYNCFTTVCGGETLGWNPIGWDEMGGNEVASDYNWGFLWDSYDGIGARPEVANGGETETLRFFDKNPPIGILLGNICC